MNSLLLIIIGFPILEIALMIKIGKMVGILNTILLIFFTAITGIYFAKVQGLNTIRSGLSQLIKNEIPVYEIISGAALAFASLLLILPGFLTDIIGFLLIIPFTRKMFINSISSKFKKRNFNNEVIEGDIEEENDKKE